MTPIKQSAFTRKYNRRQETWHAVTRVRPTIEPLHSPRFASDPVNHATIDLRVYLSCDSPQQFVTDGEEGALKMHDLKETEKLSAQQYNITEILYLTNLLHPTTRRILVSDRLKRAEAVLSYSSTA